MLRRMLAEEQELAEPAALALYRWVISREDCGQGETAEIDQETLYEYGTFLFNTMGGQAYLRRRSPRVEALTCFYALQVLDRSIQAGNNPHGVDPRPEIGRCAALLQSQPFVFADEYVVELQEGRTVFPRSPRAASTSTATWIGRLRRRLIVVSPIPTALRGVPWSTARRTTWSAGRPPGLPTRWCPPMPRG